MRLKGIGCERSELDSTDVRWGPMAGSCENGNAPSGSFIDQLSDYQLLKKDSAP
jgi:hypothetical protein